MAVLRKGAEATTQARGATESCGRIPLRISGELAGSLKLGNYKVLLHFIALLQSAKVVCGGRGAGIGHLMAEFSTGVEYD